MTWTITGANLKTAFLPLVLILLFRSVNSAEFLIIDKEISWTENAQSAFYMFMPDASMPGNWLYPDDFYNGMIYTRYEIISVATNIPCGMQFGIFQWKDENHRICGELCEDVRWLENGTGSIAVNASSPSTWWQSYGGVDFSKIGDMQSLCPTIWSKDPLSPVAKPGQGGDDAGIAWSKRFNWFPITLRVTVVAVSAGSVFSGWDNYISSGNIKKHPKPAYRIDFFKETTDKPVLTTDEYDHSINMSGAISGNGSYLPLHPGEVMFFRTKASNGLQASDIQSLYIPQRPLIPVFKIDSVNHRTNTVVTADYEYADNPGMLEAATGNGTYVQIMPGTIKYFRKKATTGSFRSNVQALGESIDFKYFSLSVYPNPGNDGLFTINTTLDIPFKAEVISPDGKVIRYIELNDSRDLHLNLHGYPKGIYFLRVKAGGTTSVLKLVMN